MSETSVRNPSLTLAALSLCALLAACVSGPGAQGPVAVARASAAPGTASPDKPSTAPAAPLSLPASLAPPAVPASSASPAAASLRLSAPTRFLSRSGESLSLTAELLDAQGHPVAAAALNWSSSRPEDFRVDAQGRVTALTDSGYSEITASLPGTGIKASLTLNVVGAAAGSSRSSGGSGGSGDSQQTPPEIQSLSASSTSVTGAGVPIQLTAAAGTGVSYSWRCLEAGCSDFVSSDEATVFWRTPAVPGMYTLEVTVTRKGLSSSEQVRINVAGGSASVEVETGSD